MSTPGRRRIRPTVSTALCISWLTSIACAGPTHSGPAFAVRDSSGVSIVENTGLVDPESNGWRLAPSPSVVVGSLDGPEEDQLIEVGGAALLSDGRIAVGDAGARNVRVFGSDGRHRTTLGGEGEGPGEFQAVHLAGVLPGDTLVVVDRRLLRISFLHPEGGFLRSESMDSGESYLIQCLGMFDGGSVLMEGLVLDALEAEGYSRRDQAFLSIGADGALLADFGRFPGLESVMATFTTDHGTATTLQSVPFGKSGPGAVAGESFYYGSQDSYEVQQYGIDGGLRRIIRLDRPPAPVTADQLEAFIAAEMAGADDETQAREIRQRHEDGPAPDFHPAFSALFANHEGFLFVQGPEIPDATSVVLDVFDHEGRLVGAVPVPDGIDEVLEIGSGHLLGLHRDELDVEYVRMYSLDRGG